MLRTTLPAASVALALALPTAAIAAPPPNDNYLASLGVNGLDGSLAPEFTDRVDTTEATTQADTFDPSRDGLPFGGGKPEPTSCPGGPVFGKTVWYDFVPPVPGGVEIDATGFDAAIAVYEWNPQSSQLGRRLVCQDGSPGPSESVQLQPELRRRQSYTIQIGGVNAAGGALDLRFTYFRDEDGDGILDELPDKCLKLQGIEAFGGCPPVVRGGPRFLFDRTGNGIRVTSLFVDRAAKRSRIEARCRRCGARVQKTARRGGTVRLSEFDGRLLGPGDRITVQIGQPKSKTGRYRFGAIGKIFAWPVLRDGLGPRTERCTEPGSSTKRIPCP